MAVARLGLGFEAAGAGLGAKVVGVNLSSLDEKYILESTVI